MLVPYNAALWPPSDWAANISRRRTPRGREGSAKRENRNRMRASGWCLWFIGETSVFDHQTAGDTKHDVVSVI
jgi:hypothetical protein